jgi:hypothetical protein
MIQVRTAYQIKFGKIDQAIALFRRLPSMIPDGMKQNAHYHILSDVSGPMYTAIEELMIPDLASWESSRQMLFGHPDFAVWFKDYQLYVEQGETDFYTLEAECEEWSRPGVIVVRQVYQARTWQIRPAVTLLQRYGALMADGGVGQKPRILTDLSGPMFQAVIEIETEDLATWETNRRALFKRPEFQMWFVQMMSTVAAGAHEFYRVEA